MHTYVRVFGHTCIAMGVECVVCGMQLVLSAWPQPHKLCCLHLQSTSHAAHAPQQKCAMQVPALVCLIMLDTRACRW